jgi:hypothetical protein
MNAKTETNVETIYHYCGIQPFLSILEAKTLWLSDLFQTNDAREGGEIIDVVCDFFTEQKISDAVINQWKNDFKNFHDYSQAFGFFMSENGDLLSQWRGYAQDGIGFAVGFNKNKLQGLVKSSNSKAEGAVILQLEKVEYERSNQKAQIQDIAQHIPELIENGALRHLRGGALLSIEPDEEEKKKREKAWKQLNMMNMVLGHFKRYSFKHIAFNEEIEWRLFASVLMSRKKGDINEISSEGFRQISNDLGFYHRSNSIVPYLKFRFDDVKLVTEVIIGPKNNTPENVVEMFLHSYGLGHVEIKQSQAPYL